jgi:hypothetical protein
MLNPKRRRYNAGFGSSAMPDPEELQRYAHWLRWITLLKSLDEATAHFLIKEETLPHVQYLKLFTFLFSPNFFISVR